MIDAANTFFYLMAIDATPHVETLPNPMSGKASGKTSGRRPNATDPVTDPVTAPVTAPVAAPVAAPVGDYVEKLLRLLRQRETLGNEDVRLAFSLKSRRRLRETYLAPAMAAGLIEYTIPEKPNSRLQKYRLTEKGRAWLSRNQP